jgi:hypothetical protein
LYANSCLQSAMPAADGQAVALAAHTHAPKF